MCEAHASARRLLRAHKLQREPVLARVELSLREARSLVRALPEEERAHVNEVYGLIARDVTNKTRARVRDRLLSDVNDLLRRRPKTWRRDARESLKRLGVSKDAGHLVDTAVRTHSSIAFNAAVWVEAQDPELWGFEYSTAGDERVRPSHRAFESGGVGVRYPKDHAFWRQFAPPNGWNCRCTLNPIYVGDPDAITVPFTGVPDVPTAFRFNPGKIFLGA
jgi:SPP1 gp7 family putative phage head morphogenesis protein